MPRRKSVLFVCIGNACRSQMAEAFARRYGSDVLAPASAGIASAARIPDITHRTMGERNIELDGQFPKPLDTWMDSEFDLIVNMSGYPMPRKVAGAVETWKVDDPMGESDDTHRRVRDQIEGQVMRLILAARAELAKQPLEEEAATPEPAPAPEPPATPPDSVDSENLRLRRRKFLR
jgi:arsenate reductase